MPVKVRYYGVPKQDYSITRVGTTSMDVGGITFYNISNGGFWIFNFTEETYITGITFLTAELNPSTQVSIAITKANGSREDIQAVIDKRNTIIEKRTLAKQVLIQFSSSILMRDIYMGIVKDFDADEVKSCKVNNALDYKKWEFPSSTAVVQFQSKDNIDFMFKQREKVQILFTQSGIEHLIGTYYINETHEIGKNSYKIEMTDAIGVLDTINFDGLVIDRPMSYNEIIRQIINEFEIEFDFESELPDIYSGVILAGTKKDALQQVMFIYSNYFCLTAATDKIKITNRAPSIPKVIDEGKTYNKATIVNETPATSFDVAIHTFNQSSEGTYYAAGDQYYDNYRFYHLQNPNAIEDNNAKSCTGATLITEDNWQTQIDFGWKFTFNLNTIYKNRFVWDGEVIGDYVKVYSESAEYSGFIEKMNFTMTNTCVVDMEIRVYDL